MLFSPRCCPRPGCPSNRDMSTPFQYQRKGSFRRKVDGRVVPRFHCVTCDRGFSSQTFRFDYRLKLPYLHIAFFRLVISKVTLRQAARMLQVNRTTLDDRLRRMGRHSKQLHSLILERAGMSLHGTFQLDELETYETDRRLCPVTMPLLIHRSTYLVIHGEVAPLPARGGLRKRDKKRKEEREKRFGKRRSGSRMAVTRCFESLSRVREPNSPIRIETDRKSTYPGIVQRTLGPVTHVRTHSKVKRDRQNLLFPINHTFAMVRDGMSRLVRRTWAASKLLQRLEAHLWIWIAWRNYIREITVESPHTTSAMAQGVIRCKLEAPDWLRWQARFTLDLSAAV